jgi:hypothetical protein
VGEVSPWVVVSIGVAGVGVGAGSQEALERQRLDELAQDPAPGEGQVGGWR